MPTGRSLSMILAIAGCTGARESATPTATNRGAGDPADFSGAVGGQPFQIRIPEAKLLSSAPTAYAWRLGTGRVEVEDLGSVGPETHFLVERSPRTIVRSTAESSFLVVTELVTTAGGRVIACTHRQPVASDAHPERAAAPGLAACSSLRIGVTST
jgi:hypothetical protein